MPEISALANFVINDRHQKGESQEEYAAHCGISKEYLSKIERGIANPTLGLIQNIASYSGATVADMLTVGKNYEFGGMR